MSCIAGLTEQHYERERAARRQRARQLAQLAQRQADRGVRPHGDLGATDPDWTARR
jgi:hypothetical protein